jgi:hypothetical protein
MLFSISEGGESSGKAGTRMTRIRGMTTDVVFEEGRIALRGVV